MTDSPLQSSSLQSSPLLTSPEVQRLLVEEKLLLIDKPAGRSSHYMVNFIRTKTGVHRVGHAGTLDPLATGLLIVLVGREATRIQDQLIGLDKEYDFSVVLGIGATVSALRRTKIGPFCVQMVQPHSLELVI